MLTTRSFCLHPINNLSLISAFKYQRTINTRRAHPLRLIEDMPLIAAVIAHRQYHQSHDKKSASSVTNSVYTARRRNTIETSSPSSILLSQCTHHRHLIQTSNFKGLPPSELNIRYFAKGKDKPKNKKANVIINEDEIGGVINIVNLKKLLEKQISDMKEEFAQNLNVRGAAGALENLQVEFEGEEYPLQELAQVGRKNQMVVLNLAALPDALKPVLNAIQNSGMNLNCQQEGTTIFVPLPKVTREHRENLAKSAKALFVKTRTGLQEIQNRFVKQTKGQSGVSEDTIYSVVQQIMKLTENYIGEAEKIMIAKQKELLQQD